MHSSDEMTENGPNHMVLLDIKLKCQGILKSEVVKVKLQSSKFPFFYLILTSTQKPNDFATLDSTTST